MSWIPQDSQRTVQLTKKKQTKKLRGLKPDSKILYIHYIHMVITDTVRNCTTTYIINAYLSVWYNLLSMAHFYFILFIYFLAVVPSRCKILQTSRLFSSNHCNNVLGHQGAPARHHICAFPIEKKTESGKVQTGKTKNIAIRCSEHINLLKSGAAPTMGNMESRRKILKS